MNCRQSSSDKIASGQLRVENKLRVIIKSTTMSGNEAKNVSADADGRPTADNQQAPHHPLANQRDVGSWRAPPFRASHHCIHCIRRRAVVRGRRSE